MSARTARVAWLLRRLRNMSAAEVLHRAREVSRRRLVRRRLQGWAQYASQDGTVPVLPGLRERVLASDAGQRSALAQAAKRFRDGHFEALGVRWPAGAVSMSFPARIWSLDPCTGRQWPSAQRFCFDIPYRMERGLGDVKYVWEFGRLQFLPVLAADVLLRGTPASLDAIDRALNSWYGENPPFQGVHWAELLNVAMRAISVLVALSLCGDRLPRRTIQRARALLAAHARLLGLFPSLHSSANNHLVAECAAQYLLAVAMPELPTSAAAHAWARHELNQQVLLQILPDGWPAEQSPSYGAFTAEFVLLAAVVAQAADEPFPASTRERLLAFADHVQALANDRGLVPSLCDNDEGRVLAQGGHEADYPVSVAAAIAAVFGQALRLPAAPAPRLRDAVFGRARCGGAAPHGQRRFEHGGCSIDRRRLAGRSCVLSFDHGPLGYLSIAAHGHADALAVTLDVDARPVLVDPGTYLYHSGGAWRDWFRSTRAHNTLNLGGADQSRMAGPFNWSAKAGVRVHAVEAGPHWRWSASHDGYVAAFGVRHERSVAALADGYRIVDRLVGRRSPGPAEVVFQLGVGCHAVREDGGFAVYDAAGPVARLVFEAPGELQCRRGGALGMGGWVSPRFGVREPVDRISWRGAVPEGGAAVRIHVLPHPGGAAAEKD